MSEIIQNWLSEQIGAIVDTTPEKFGQRVKDGHMIATLLYNHGVIDLNQLGSIKVSNSMSHCVANLKKISDWLQKIGIQCSNSLINFIASGHGSSALRLFYQLYLTLEDRYRLERFKLKSQDRIVLNKKTPAQREELCKASRHEDDISKIHLESPLMEQKELLKWYKNKYKEERQKVNKTRENYKNRRSDEKTSTSVAYRNIIIQEEQKGDDFSKFKKQVEKYEEYLKKRDKDEIPFKKLDEIEQINSSGYVSVLKKRKNRHVFQHNIKDQVHKMLLNELCTEILTKQEKELNYLIAKKLMNQSEYEKRLMTKLLEVRHQKHVCIENRRMVDNMINMRQEEEYNKVLLDQMSDVARVQRKADLESKRAVELHKRLFAERMRKKSQKHYEECQKIVEAFMDIASKTSDYERCYEMSVPKTIFKQWKTLYRAAIPISEDTTKENSKRSEESIVSYEEIVQHFKERDEVLNKQDFHEYITNAGDWSLDVLPPEYVLSDIYELFCRGENVLGHIVHKLLLIKYPIPSATTPAELPSFIVSACVVGLEDSSILSVVQDLLSKRDITVVEVQTAINYCLEAYKQEKIEIDAIVAQRREVQTSEQQIKQEGTEEVEFTEPEEEEIAMSQKGLLGQLVDEYFSTGEPIPDCKIVDVLIEYLKSLITAKGWVLFDFPTKLSQAILLEYKITSKVISKMLLKLNSRESIGYSQASIPLIDPLDDPYVETRKSNLVTNPHPDITPDSFETFLTAYIKVKHVLSEDEIEEYMQPDLDSALEQFYTDQGVFYSLLYENNDFEMIKRLVKLIIGDYSLPLKSSVELMGEGIENIESEFGKKKNVKQVEKKKNSLTKKKSSEVIPVQNKEPQVEDVSKIESIQDVPVIEEEVINIYEPGDPDWEYVNIPQPIELTEILPTFWENVEKNYIEELNAFFFLKRSYWSSVVPYMSYIRDHVKTFINRPDNKQDFVFKFQEEYNQLEEDLRHDIEVKAEFHCRLSALRNHLWSICDERATNAEKERQRLIEDNWTLDQLIALSNLFISVMQLELNRCADTLQLIYDYYLAMLGTKPDLSTKYKKIELSKVKTKMSPDDQKEQKDNKEQKEKMTGHSIKQKKRSNISVNTTNDLSSFLIKIFLNPVVHFNLEGTQLDQTLIENHRTALSTLELWSKNSTSSIDAEKDLLDPKKGSKKAKSDKYSSPSQMLLITEKSENLFKEWSCVVRYEIKRATVQIDLLKENALKEVMNLFKHAESMFHGLYRDIAQRYDKEIKSVAKLCLVMSKAIEEEIKLHPQLALVDDTFLVIGNELLYAIEPRLLPPIVDQTADAEFSVNQLENLFRILHYTAPSGSITQKAFVYIFEDLIVINMENSTRQLLPPVWYQVCTYDVSKIVSEIFGDSEYIDWRDFIVSSLDVPFPNEFQILSTLKKLIFCDPDLTEHISYTKYVAVELWFEKEMICSGKEWKIKTIKNIIFGMFKSDEMSMNYSDFLLHFCRDLKPIGGLIKAVTLTFKSLVCWNEDEGNKFMKLEREKEIEMQRTLSFSNRLCSNIVESAMDECDGVVLKEIYSASNVSSSSKIQSEKSSLENVEEESDSYHDICCICCGSQSMQECITQGSDFDFTFFLEEKKFYLSFQPLLAVFILSLPWHLRLQHSPKETIRKELKFIFKEIGLPNRHVFAHQFFHNEFVEKLVSINNKFKIVNHADILTKYIQSNTYKKCIQ